MDVVGGIEGFIGDDCDFGLVEDEVGEFEGCCWGYVVLGVIE